MKILRYEGSNYFKQRFILSVLSGVPIIINNIRSKSESPGVTEFEITLIKLLEQITNGSEAKISETGTKVMFKPGILSGGKTDLECDCKRGIGYYLEVLLCLAPFCKVPLKVSLKGVTNGGLDPSVDFLKATSVPLLSKFGVNGDIELKILKRGVSPDGGGEITFHCPIVKKLRPIKMLEQGKVKRIRGVAFSTRVSPQMANRLVSAARSILNKFLPDIYIYTDHRKGNQCGKSPGFGITLIAETTEGTYLAAEACSTPKGGDPEDIGVKAANMLLDEICKGGCIDSVNQSLAALMMVLGEQNVVKTLTGPLTDYSIEFLRHIRDFFDVKFRLQSQTVDSEEQGNRLGSSKVLLTCVGIGFSNIAKTTL